MKENVSGCFFSEHSVDGKVSLRFGSISKNDFKNRQISNISLFPLM